MELKELNLMVETTAGCQIDRACMEGIELAKRLDITVGFKFNGVYVTCNKESVPQILVEDYYNEVRREK